MSNSWDGYCERGEQDCCDMMCSCTDSFGSRYRNARARKYSVVQSLIYAIFKGTK